MLPLLFAASVTSSSTPTVGTPNFCYPQAQSTPSRVARLETALGRLHAIHIHCGSLIAPSTKTAEALRSPGRLRFSKSSSRQ